MHQEQRMNSYKGYVGFFRSKRHIFYRYPYVVEKLEIPFEEPFFHIERATV